MNEIKTKFFNKKTYLISDETKKNNIKYFAVIAGIVDEPSEQHLIHLNCGTYTCDAQLVVNELNNALSAVKISFKNVLLIISDAVSYNMAAKKILQKKYNSIAWTTCTAHLLHNCCDKMKNFFVLETRFMILMNDFMKRSRVKPEKLSIEGNFPELIQTRWGSWLQTVEFYAKNFGFSTSFILSNDFPLNSERNMSIKKLV